MAISRRGPEVEAVAGSAWTPPFPRFSPLTSQSPPEVLMSTSAPFTSQLFTDFPELAHLSYVFVRPVSGRL